MLEIEGEWVVSKYSASYLQRRLRPLQAQTLAGMEAFVQGEMCLIIRCMDGSHLTLDPALVAEAIESPTEPDYARGPSPGRQSHQALRRKLTLQRAAAATARLAPRHSLAAVAMVVASPSMQLVVCFPGCW